jgi:NADH dehydrogenase FAD-containing subunit
MSENKKVHNILIIGGGFSGITIAHKLLKSSIPAISRTTGTIYKITMVSQSTHFWWSVGAPRAMLAPYPNDVMDSFLPIEQAFKHYPLGVFEFVHGEATSLNTDARSVAVKDPKNGEVHDYGFHALIIATGATSSSPLFSLHCGHESTLDAYRHMQASAPNANTMLIVGGGSAGVETAGELGSLYGNTKTITLVSSTDNLLPGLRPAIGNTAQKYLEEMGVKVVEKTNMVSTTETAEGKTKVVFDSGETQIVDILIMATGRKASTTWIPSVFLDSRGAVKVDEFLRVVGAGECVYALGDVVSLSRGNLLDLRDMVPILIGNMEVDLGIKGMVSKPFIQNKSETMLVPVGKSKGVGALFGWRVPSWVVWLIKGRNFMFPTAVSYLNGTAV